MILKEMESQLFTRQFKNLSSTDIKVTIKKCDDTVLEVCVEKVNINKSYTKVLCILFLFNLLLMIFLRKEYVIMSIMVLISFYVYQIVSEVQYEHLLVVKSLGYQVKKTYKFTNDSHFIPWANVEDIFINEVISIQRVIFMLVFIMNENNKSKTVLQIFKSLQPRLDCLELIYQHLQDII